MNRKTVAAMLVGFVVGAAILSLRWTQDAQAQRPEKGQRWEYKVVDFVGSPPQKHEQRLNELADEGWEYVGLLNAGSASRGAVAGAGVPGSTPSGLVAFKRPKR